MSKENSIAGVDKSMLYNDAFYRERHQKTLYPASRILAAFFHIVPGKHTSAIDFGCGVGTWLSVCAKRGLSICGIDGPWVPQRYLQIPPEHFHAFDLEACLLDRTSPLWSIPPADVLLSLEVAEHFAANVADAFAAFVCTHCEYALFSAAIPHQGGEGHVNEQWPSYWAEKFQNHDFVMLDVFRARIWDDQQVPYWYRQNCFLLTKRAHLEKLSTVGQEAIVTGTRHNLVHPDHYTKMLELFTRQQAKPAPAPARSAPVKPTLSVIIPTRNRPAFLKDALHSLAADYSGQSLEVLVMDNGSTDNTRLVVEQFAASAPFPCAYHPVVCPGLHVCRNLGAQRSRGDILAYLDDDVLIKTGWISAILQRFASEPQLALLSGPCEPAWEGDPPTWVEQFREPRNGDGWMMYPWSLQGGLDDSSPAKPGDAVGANYIVRKAVVLQAGGFRPDGLPVALLRYRGDGETGLSDLLLRAKLPVAVDARVAVWHRVPRSRLTLGYLRFAYKRSGISYAYAQARRNQCTGLTAHAFQHLYGAARRVLPWLRRLCTGQTALKQFFEMYREIILSMHLLHIRFCPPLQVWVLQKSYFIDDPCPYWQTSGGEISRKKTFMNTLIRKCCTVAKALLPHFLVEAYAIYMRGLAAQQAPPATDTAETAPDYCPYCEKHSTFFTYGTIPREHARCPNCFSLERDRAMFYVFQTLFLTKTQEINLLHFAPDRCAYELFLKKQNIHYYCCDIAPEQYAFAKKIIEKQDGTKTTYKNNFFDVIIASQVIEHLDDHLFLKEMYRILKKNGILILTTMVFWDEKLTLDKPELRETKEDRIRYYVHEDHVRRYGADIAERFSGHFDVQTIRAHDMRPIGDEVGSNIFILRPKHEGMAQ